MRIIIIGILMLVFIPIVIAQGLPICSDDPEISTDCMMVTPELHHCNPYDYAIFNTSNTVVETGLLTPFTAEQDVYYFNFSQPGGEYLVRLCDGGTREVFVKEDPDARLFLYLIAGLLFFSLMGMGYWIEEPVFVTIAGMLSMMFAWEIFLSGFPGLTSTLLRDGIVTVLAGIGMFLVIAPWLEEFENWNLNMLKVQ